MIESAPRADRVRANKYIVIHGRQVERGLLHANVRFDADDDHLRPVDCPQRVPHRRLAAGAEGRLLENSAGAAVERFLNRRVGMAEPRGVLLGGQDGDFEDGGDIEGDDGVWAWEDPVGLAGGVLVFVLSRCSSGCRHSAVTSATAARALGSSTMAFLAA